MEEPISGLRTAGKKVINLRCELVTKNGRYVYEKNQRKQVIGKGVKGGGGRHAFWRLSRAYPV